MSESPHASFVDLLSSFASLSLEEMDAVRLMNRVDTKYVCTEAALRAVLAAAAQEGYRVLETEGERLCPYDSIYFDTPSLSMYRAHRSKRLVRQKVRTRAYVLSGTAFLEIKRKNNHGRTKKKRTGIPLSRMKDFSCDEGAVSYLAAHSSFRVGEIVPSLETLFRRITLVNPALTERLTIDTGLRFSNFRSGKEASLQDAVIIELKQDGLRKSRMKEILLRERIHPLRISKYCIGTALTDPSVRPGCFKLKIRAVEKLIDKIINVI